MEVLKLARYLEDSYGKEKGRVWLQKTLYYLQGYSLVVEGMPLFSEDFTSFPKGPMIPELHKTMKKEPPQPLSEQIDVVPFLFVDVIANILVGYSGEELASLSHTSAPWKTVPEGSLLAQESIKTTFGKAQFEKLLLADGQKVVEEVKQREERMRERFSVLPQGPNCEVKVVI